MHVCIIGAGVIGVTSAYMLAREGLQVTLIDEHPKPALATSEANGGQLSYSYVAPLAAPGVLTEVPRWLLRKDSPLHLKLRCDIEQWRWLLSFALACSRATAQRTTAEMLSLSYLSRDTLHAWLNDISLDFDLRRNGKLIVYRDQAHVESARTLADYQAGYGAQQRVLSRDEVLALEPSLTPIGAAIAGATYTEGEEAGDCRKFTQGLFDHLASRPDVSFQMNTRVQQLRTEGRRIVAARTNHGEIEADAFVMAGGMGSRALLQPLGVNPPICGLKGYSLTVPLHGDPAVGPSVNVTDYQRRIVYARLGDTLRIAAKVVIGARDAHPEPQRIASLKGQVHDTFPQLDLDAATPWAGLRPATFSGKPIISSTPAAENLWLNIGHGALGFTLSCGSARLLAALITQQHTPIDATPFRFQG